MKHIKKKFLHQVPIEEFDKNNPHIEEKFSVEDIDHSKLRSVKKGSEIIIYTDEHAIRSFAYKDKISGDTFPVPEPDPVLIYFNFAQGCYRQIKDKRKDLVSSLNPKEKLDEDMMQRVFDFFGLSSSCIIFLATSLEAFLNQIIPDKYVHISPKNNRTEHYSKLQIQRGFNTKDKFKSIVPASLGLNEIKTNQKLYKGISDLIDLRNDLIHTKDEQGNFKYANISGKLLNHDYDKSILSVRDGINYFKADYIKECDCGNDF